MENTRDATEVLTRWKKEDRSQDVLEYAIEIYPVELNNAARSDLQDFRTYSEHGLVIMCETLL